MNEHRRLTYRARPPGLLTRVATALVAAAMLIGAFFLGLFALAVFAGLALIVTVTLAVRIWLVRRSLARRAGTDTRAQSPGEGRIIEGEFIEVRRRASSRRGPP